MSDENNSKPVDEDGAAGEKDKDNNKSTKKVPSFIVNSISEVGEWINYLGDFKYLEFAEPVLDKEEKVLVQKNSSLRKNSFEALKKRHSEDISKIFVFKYNREFKDQCKKLINESIYICLEPKNYHIAPLFIKKSKVNFKKVGDFVFESKELLDLFVNMDKQNDPLMPHLGEVALVSAGIVEKFITFTNREEELKEALKLSFLSGLLHDISLKGDSDFLVNDLEKAKQSGHEGKSQIFIEKYFRTLDSRVGKIVSEHHREIPKWEEGTNQHLSLEQLVSESLNFTEYFFTLIRMSYTMKSARKGEHFLENVFFTLGQSFGKGYFHPTIYKIITRLQESFQRILKFGVEIGKLEQKCLFATSAVAYPVPLCTQVLCRDKRYNCEFIQPVRPINVIHYTNIFGRAGEYLAKGEYPKCKLSEQLPLAPKEISGL